MTTTYPPTAFYFKVDLGGVPGMDSSFSEVSGIKSEMELDTPYHEGGENSFLYQLPKGVKHPNLVLKRGIGPVTSPLVIWCMSVFSGLSSGITPMPVGVKLLNEYGLPLRYWWFSDAFPVKWEVDGFKSTKNEVAIETIEFCYTTLTRMI